MAVAALVSCSKEEEQGPALDSKNKTVEITIANASTNTRVAGGNTATGDDTDLYCAEAKDLKVLFADSEGKILNELALANQATADNHVDGTATDVGSYTPGYVADADTYIWHNVNWAVTQIAVVRYEAKDFPNGTINLNLSDVLTKATDENGNIAREIDDIVLYGQGDLSDTGATHRINDIVYHVWHTEVTVAPAFARFEINNFQCDDLGDANHDYIQAVDEDNQPLVDEDGNPVYTDKLDNSTYGFDELTVTGLKWRKSTDAEGTYSYTAVDFSGKLYGSYVSAKAPEGTPTTGRKNDMKASNGVWSWNVAPNTIFDELVVDMTAFAYDYTINSTSVPLTVIDLAGAITGNKFEAGHIYTLDLSFNEANIIDPEGLCVTVKVTIQPWTVNVVTPVFKNN